MRRLNWLLLVSTVACRHVDRALPVPPTTGPVTIEGEWDEPDWSRVALREQFVDDSGGLARPSSEIRFLHDATTLYVGLYAADDNIQSIDAFEVSLDSLELRVDATGKVSPTVPGLRVGIDRDGTLDDPSNFDEEWVLELAIPLSATTLAPDHATTVRAKRCDTPKQGGERCGGWTGSIRL